MKRIYLWPLLLPGLIFFLSSRPAMSQEILLDKGVKAGPLQVFQDYHDPKVYYYVPDKAHLSEGDDGRPEFSFLKYVNNEKSKPGDDPNTEGEGGGIVHCLVQLGATPDDLSEARSELRRVVPGATIAGPVIFRSGKFGIISSFKQQNGDLTTAVVGIGSAPILDGEKAAVSIKLTKLGAKILWDSFKTATPDISFTFEMEMAGYRNPYEASLEADFDQIYKHRDLAVGFASQYLGAQIRDTFDDLRSTGAIKIVTKGDDAKLDTLLGSAYGKICEMMFDKVDTGSAGPGQAGIGGGNNDTDLIQKAGDYLKTQRESVRAENQAGASLFAASSGVGGSSTGAGGTGGTAPADNPRDPNPRLSDADYVKARQERKNGGAGGTSETKPQPKTEPSFALLASYTMKTVHRSGKFSLSFNKFMADTLQLRFDQNIGNLSALMNDPKHFFAVNLDDPVFKQREVSVYLDGQNAADFASYVNYVTVRLRKKHETGDITNDEVRIDRDSFSKNGNYFKLLYGWKDDTDRNKWMNYEYNEVWSFFGGKEVDLGWKPGGNFALTVTPPYQKRTLHLEADPKTVQDAGVRLITVKVYTADAAGVEHIKQASLNPAAGTLSQTMDYVRPGDKLDYAYEISWRMKDGKVVESGKKTASDDFLFCDNVPGNGGV